jgi:hypothetical protein
MVILHCNSAAEKVLALYNTGLLQRAEVESYHSALVAIEAQKAAAVQAAQQKAVELAVGSAVGLSGASQVCANCLRVLRQSLLSSVCTHCHVFFRVLIDLECCYRLMQSSSKLKQHTLLLLS